MKYSYGCTLPAYGDRAWSKHNVKLEEHDLVHFLSGYGIDPELVSVPEKFNLIASLAETLLSAKLVSEGYIPKELAEEVATKLKQQVQRFKDVS